MSYRLLPLLLGAFALLAPASEAQLGIRSKLMVEGFQEPTVLTWAPGFPNMMVVGEKDGRVRLVRDGEILPQDLIDLSNKVTVGGLSGFQNLIFHPRYFANGWFYVHYQNADNNTVVERYTVPVPGSFQADAASAMTLVGPLIEPIVIHAGGGMCFDYENRLYIAIGDRRLELPGESCQAQDPTTVVGKLLRFEDDGSIPADNPFVNDPGTLDEIFAFGFRQPYRMEFDSLTGGIVIGDVGEGSREEINYIPPGTSGQNFGWQVVEGELCTPSIPCSSFMCPNPALNAPVFAYTHQQGCAVIAGPTYRGGAIPSLFGATLLSDWCNGTIWALGISVTGNLFQQVKLEEELAPTGGLVIDTINTWAQDLDGEVYLADQGFGFNLNGEIYKVLPRAPFEVNRDTLSLATGGNATFRIDAGVEHADEVFVVLGSLSDGVTPFGQFQIPLALDAYFLSSLANPNSGPLPDSFGVLDSEGQALASFVLPAGLPTSLFGTELHHAALTVDVAAGAAVSSVTNNERIRLIN